MFSANITKITFLWSFLLSTIQCTSWYYSFYPLNGYLSPVYISPYSNILRFQNSRQNIPNKSLVPQSRHSLDRDHTHEHDTNEAIQTILNTLVKQTDETTFTCNTTGAYPHPLDCSKYFLCDEDEQPKEFECLYDFTGLLFDSVSKSCVWAAKAKCFSDKFSDIEAVEAEFEPDFDCEEPGFNPDPDYCMRYYRCDQNLEVHLEYCATGTFYDVFLEKCLWASNVECENRQEVDLGFEDDIFRRFY